MPGIERRSLEATRESREARERRQLFADTVWGWTAALEVRSQREHGPAHKLPLRERLGAAAVPTIFMTLLVGCSTRYEELECTEDDQAYTDRTIEWADEHPEEIQAEMDLLWGNDAKASAQDIVDALVSAKVKCGVPKNENKIETSGGRAYLHDDAVIINVESSVYQDNLEQFLAGEYTAEWGTDFLATVQTEEAEDAHQYALAIMKNLDYLVHEAAHLALGTIHGPETVIKIPKLIKQAEEEEWSSEQLDLALADLDRVYGWGVAAQQAARQWANERDLVE